MTDQEQFAARTRAMQQLLPQIQEFNRAMQASTERFLRKPTEEDWQQHWRDHYAHIEPSYTRWKAFMLEQRDGRKANPAPVSTIVADSFKESLLYIAVGFAAALGIVAIAVW